MGMGAKAARGSAVTLGGQVVKFVIQVVSLMVLSRLLSPEAFGVVAIMTAVVAFTELFRDFGLTPAAIQTAVLTHKQASNLFWINTAIGLVVGTVLAFSGIPLAAVFGEASLVEIAPVVGVASLFIGMGAQYRVSLSRELRFTALTVSEVVGQLAGAVAAIVAAAYGAGVGALALQILVTQVVLFITRSIASNWQPGLPTRSAPMSHFYKYGGNLFASQVLTYLSGNVDTYMIGLNWGAGALGIYNRAFTLMTLPIRQSLTPLTNVFLPMLSRIKDEKERYFRALLKVQFALGSIVVFGYAMAVALSPEIVYVVLGEQWLDSAPIFSLLAIGGVFQLFSHLNYWVFLSQGVTSSLLAYNLITKTLTVAVIIGASFHSVEAVATAYAISLAVSWPINVYWLKRVVTLPASVFLANGLSILVAGAISYLAVTVLRSVLPGAWILIAVLPAAVIYVVVLLAPPQTRALLLSSMRWATRVIRRTN